MNKKTNLSYRLRIPVVKNQKRRYVLQGKGRKYKKKTVKGGFLPALIPLIAAAIGAVPGIASVALQASHKN